MQENMGGNRPFLIPPKSNKEIEQQDRAALLVLPKVIASENEIITHSSREHFNANLLSAEAIAQTIRHIDENLDEYDSDAVMKAIDIDSIIQETPFFSLHETIIHQLNIALKRDLTRDFVQELSQQADAMGRFSLFMDDEYFPYMKSLDLGKTDDANNTVALEYMQEQYRAIRDWLIENGFTDGELARETSGREIHFRPDASIKEGRNKRRREKVSPKWSIGVRNRPLVRFEKDGFEVTIVKRMTFAVRPYTAEALGDSVGNVTDARNMELIEQLLDMNDPDIKPIRTLYYIKKSKIKK